MIFRLEITSRPANRTPAFFRPAQPPWRLRFRAGSTDVRPPTLGASVRAPQASVPRRTKRRSVRGEVLGRFAACFRSSLIRSARFLPREATVKNGNPRRWAFAGVKSGPVSFRCGGLLGRSILFGRCRRDSRGLPGVGQQFRQAIVGVGRQAFEHVP